MKWPVVLFDLDGTLLGVDRSVLRTAQMVFQEYDIEITDDELRPELGPPFYVMLGKLGVRDEDVQSWIDRYRELYQDHMYDCDHIPGLPQLLRKLVDDGARLAVATSKAEKYAAKIVEHFEFPVETVGGATLDSSRITKGDVVEHVLKRMDWSGPAVMIGDHVADIKGARQNELDTIAVTWGTAPLEELVSAEPDYLVHNAAELAAVLY